MDNSIPATLLVGLNKAHSERSNYCRRIMKYKAICLAIAAAGALLTGCETPEGTPDRTATGALLGGAIGVASGALLGGHHHAGEAALIGGGIGAVTGGLIGHSMDADERARLRAQAPETYARVDTGQPVGIEDVKAMSRSGVSDEVIISQIRNTRTAYRLSAADIIALHDAGVSQAVIDYMINTPTTAGAAPPPAAPVEVAQAPPPPQTETVVVAPGPGYTWIPGEWEWRGRWVWVGGFWAAPPYTGAIWIHGGWYHGPHGWYHTRGYWRH